MSRLDRLWHAAWLAASAAFILMSARSVGATFDEPVYLTLGTQVWRDANGAGLASVGTMPLPATVHCLPLAVAGWWRGEAVDPMACFAECLPLVRAMNLVFWVLLLGFGRKLGRSLGGSWGGRLAVAFLACEPTLLAHAGLATTDVPLAACWLGWLVTYREARNAPADAGRWRRVGAPALWLGLTVLAKVSGIAFAGLALIAVELERLVVTRRFAEAYSPLRQQLAIGTLAVAFVVVACGGKPHRKAAVWVEAHVSGGALVGRVLRHNPVGGYAWRTAAFQWQHNRATHGSTYLLGRTTAEPLSYYFLAALLFKLTPPMLIAACLHALRPRVWFTAAGLACVALLMFTPLCRVQIGIRLVLPMIVAFAVTLGCAAADGLRKRPWFAVPTVGAGLVLMPVFALLTGPRCLCYVNPLGGGTDFGYLALSDSNFDWGQGLPDLERYRTDHPGRPLKVWYFGTDPAAARFESVPLPADVTTEPASWFAERWAGCDVAVGTSILYGFLGEPPAVLWLREQEPVGRTGTFVIVRIP